ncbi:MAG TPA: short-chain dehydrogenase, partial [Spongiibacteraceae bacterium]|nr:short-chain dehydrogenase [Spongiibacteraceae bacterium]
MSSEKRYQGRVAIVTGASSGIGLETARLLARSGATVVAVARREERLAALLAQLQADSPDSIYLAGDISDKAFAGGVVQQVAEQFGRVDILINNAGVPLHRMIYKITADEAEAVMRTNFLSCLWTSFAAIPFMLRDGGGIIVNVSSFGSKVPPTHEAVYVASKCAMNGFTRGLWGDLQGSGIHAMLVHPGPIATEIWSKLDEPGAYSGEVYPADLVARQLLAAMDK